MGQRRSDGGDVRGRTYVRSLLATVGFTAATCLAIGLCVLVLYASVVLLEPYVDTTRRRSLIALATFVTTIATVAYLLVVLDRELGADDER